MNGRRHLLFKGLTGFFLGLPLVSASRGMLSMRTSCPLLPSCHHTGGLPRSICASAGWALSAPGQRRRTRPLASGWAAR